MFIQITGLDGSGTSSIGERLVNKCDNAILLKTPSPEYKDRNIIDTVVSNRVAGIPIDLNYNVYGNDLLIPDLTLFVYTDENIRQTRITGRGKSELDKVLDDEEKRLKSMKEFDKFLVPEKTIMVNNSSLNIDETVDYVYSKINTFKRVRKL